jgi:hypothetical protein
VPLDLLNELGIVPTHPPQSIYELDRAHLDALLPALNLGFAA